MNELDKLYNQKAFDIAAQHLINQGCCALNDEGVYCYRLGNLKCAIGALIPDELYDTRFEYQNVESLLSLSPLIQELFENVRIDLLSDLQKIHDKVEVSDWRGYLKELAGKYDLEFKFN